MACRLNNRTLGLRREVYVDHADYDEYAGSTLPYLLTARAARIVWSISSFVADNGRGAFRLIISQTKASPRPTR